MITHIRKANKTFSEEFYIDAKKHANSAVILEPAELLCVKPLFLLFLCVVRKNYKCQQPERIHHTFDNVYRWLQNKAERMRQHGA